MFLNDKLNSYMNFSFQIFQQKKMVDQTNKFFFKKFFL